LLCPADDLFIERPHIQRKRKSEESWKKIRERASVPVFSV